MRHHIASEYYDIPQFDYFRFGNVFTGSYKDLNYKIIPDKELTVQVWHGKLCSELAEIEEEQVYPMDQDGFSAMLRWLEARCPDGENHEPIRHMNVGDFH